jgi:hypothetical protein
MNLLDENNFVENKNGRISQAQFAELQTGANIWFDVLLLAGIAAIVGGVSFIEPRLSWTIPGSIGLGIFALWMFFRTPVLIKHYLMVMPDVRANQLVYASGKLAFHRKYVLQTEEARLSLPGDKNEGLLAGNYYEVCYLPRTRMAISARLTQPVSKANQAREFTLLFGQLLGFTEEEIQANRNSEFTASQKITIIKKNWWLFFTTLIALGYVLWALGPALIPSALMGDTTIIFWLICPGAITLLTLILIFGGMKDVRNLFALSERKVEQKEGAIHLWERTSTHGKSRTTHYYLSVNKLELQISQHVYEVLINDLYCRVYYTPRFKYLASLEVTEPQAEALPINK